MRNESIRAVEELALSDPNVVVVASDPGPDFMPELAARHPERLMLEGVCEQALIGMAAGLASEGFYPIIVMIAVFGTRRCYEQVLLDFGLHRFSGCVVGVGAGFSYSLLGPTHIAVDDLMLASAVPGSATLAPADAEEAVSLLRQARSFSGLSYMRLAATTAPLSSARDAIALGKGRLLAEPGAVLFISCGSATLAVEPAIMILKDSGVQAGAVHLHTIKPLDVDLILRHVKHASVVVCVEEHRKIGGLSSAILHALATAERPSMPARFASVGVDDGFPEGYGSYQEMMEHYGISGVSLARRTQDLLASINP